MHKAALLLLTIILLPGVFAEGFATTLIHGYVFDGQGNPVSDYDVRIVCWNDDDVPPVGTAGEQWDVTDENGKFFALFQEYGCSIGSYAFACVGSSEPDGTPLQICTQTQVDDVNTTLELQIEQLDIRSVPEFSTMAAVVAASGAGLLFMYLRRR